MNESAPSDSPLTPELARGLADRLANAWSRGRIEDLVGLFAEEAVFQETPFSTPVAGREQIRKWASDIPYYQSEAKFTTGEVMIAGPWFSCEFKLVFRRRTTGEWVEARGAMFFETGAGAITELRMYWHRWNGGRETSLP